MDNTMDWADLLTVMSTTLVNGTIGNFSREKPPFFYGTTATGSVHLMVWGALLCSESLNEAASLRGIFNRTDRAVVFQN